MFSKDSFLTLYEFLFKVMNEIHYHADSLSYCLQQGLLGYL